MSLNLENSVAKPCTKPYELSLNDCLACSGCITNQDLNDLNKKIDLSILTGQFLFLISPHSKINMYNEVLKILYDACIEDTAHDISHKTLHTITYDITQEQSTKIANNTTSTQNMKQNSKKYIKHLTYDDFEDLLLDFVTQKYKHKIIDISHAYQLMYEYAAENITDDIKITSSCPGVVVAYVERKGHHLVENLLRSKSPQQILCNSYKDMEIISVVTCYDKKLEESTIKHTINTVEYMNFLINNGFIEYLHSEQTHNAKYDVDDRCNTNTKKCSDITKTNKNSYKNNDKDICSNDQQLYHNLHKTCAVNEHYIEYFCKYDNYENVEIKNVKKNFTIYTCKKNGKEYKFARIYGLTNSLNFINSTKKVKNVYNFVEAFICEYSCINGPVQIKNKLEEDMEYMQNNIHENTSHINIDKKQLDVSRQFTKQKQNKKEYKIEW
ncbi:hypothetical protein BDAP_000732 [Binucleata daphniae]